MLLELTTHDLLLLEQYRLQRFRSFFFSALMSCPLCLADDKLDDGKTLIIHCLDPEVVDQLLSQMDQLRWYARLVLGVHCLTIQFVQEEIYRTATNLADDL